MLIAKDRVVAFHYTLTNSRGDTLDTTRGGLPLLYLHGHRNLLPGLEQRLEGHSSGDCFTVTLVPEEAYGLRDGELVQRLPCALFDATAGIAVGDTLQAQSEDGELPVQVIAVDAESITVDGNHPLAGETLHYAIEIRHVREAAEDELEEGVADA